MSNTTPNPIESIAAFMDELLNYSFAEQASDIHIEPNADGCLIRLRIDDKLIQYKALNKSEANRITLRFKALAKLNTSPVTKPTDSRFQYSHNNKRYDIRLNITPCWFGERLALRLQRGNHNFKSLDKLGLTTNQINALKTKLQQPQGMILVVGPTGCGKSTTLYALINHLINPNINILTAEDPVEMIFAGISQCNIQPEAGFDFADALIGFLRQDPNVIMIGEIRDAKTAKMAFQAVQTGHLVLSSLHTENSLSSIQRLNSLGIDNLTIKQHVSMIISQRLLRKSNNNRGRLAIYECLNINKSKKEVLTKSLTKSFDQEHKYNQHKYNQHQCNHSHISWIENLNLHAAAKNLVNLGLVDQQEVYRVLGGEE